MYSYCGVGFTDMETEAQRASVHDKGHMVDVQENRDLPLDSRFRTLVSGSPTSYPHTAEGA